MWVQEMQESGTLWIEYDKRGLVVDQKVVLIGYPLDGGDPIEIARVIIGICKEIQDEDIVPYSPEFLFLPICSLKEAEWQRRIAVARRLGLCRGFFEELWLFGDHLTQEMKEEIIIGVTMGIPVVGMTVGVKEGMVACMKEYQDNRPPPGTRIH